MSLRIAEPGDWIIPQGQQGGIVVNVIWFREVAKDNEGNLIELADLIDGVWCGRTSHLRLTEEDYDPKKYVVLMNADALEVERIRAVQRGRCAV